MKKTMNGLLLGLLVLILMPVGANAAGGYSLDVKKEYCTVTKCEATDEKCESTCFIYINNDGAEIDTLSLKITPSNGVTIKSVTGTEVKSDVYTGTWTATGTTNAVLTITPAIPATVTGKIPVAKVVTEYNKNTDCSISVSLGGQPSQEVTIVTEVTKTGAELPIAILACGAGIAAIIYLTVRKNTKLYKI